MGDQPRSQIEKSDEESLEYALEKWLPAAYPSSVDDADYPASAVRARIANLSEQLSIKHHDFWLRDFLEFRSGPQFPLGVSLLAKTVKENQAGHPDEDGRGISNDSETFLALA